MKKAFTRRAIITGIIVFLLLLGFGMLIAFYEGVSRDNLFSKRWWKQTNELLFYIFILFIIIYPCVVFLVHGIRLMLKESDEDREKEKEETTTVLKNEKPKTKVEKIITSWAAPHQTLDLHPEEIIEVPDSLVIQHINRFHRMFGTLQLTNERFIFTPNKTARRILPFSKTQKPIEILRSDIAEVFYRTVPRNKYLNIITKSGQKFSFLVLKKNPAFVTPFIKIFPVAPRLVVPQSDKTVIQPLRKEAEKEKEQTLSPEFIEQENEPVIIENDARAWGSGFDQPAKKINLWLLFFVFLTFGLSILVAILYMLVIWVIPFIYLKFIVTVFAGGIMGIGVVSMIYYGGLRNKFLSYSFGVLAGLFSMYCCWAIYCSLIDNIGDKIGIGSLGFHSTTFDLDKVYPYFYNPSAIIEKAKLIMEYGGWSYRGEIINGWTLVVIWIVELGLYLTVNMTMIRTEFKRIEEGNEETPEENRVIN